MKSIRREMMVWLIATVGVLLVIFGVSLYQYVRLVLTEWFDEALLDQAKAVGALTMQEPDGHLDFELNPISTPQFLAVLKPQYYQVWTLSDVSFARSPSLQGGDMKPISKDTTPYFSDIRLPDGRLGRRVDLKFRPALELVGGKLLENPPPPAPEMMVVIARERESLDNTLTNIKGFSLLASLMIAAGGAVAVSLIVSRTMRTLRWLGVEVDSIQPDNLKGRLSTDHLPSELWPIVSKWNSLLDRLQAALEREHRFTADAAHELRTPVAELRTLADVVGNWTAENPAINEAFRDAREIAIRMEKLISALLNLSRHEAGTLIAETQRVDICLIFDEVRKQLDPAAVIRGISFQVEIPASAFVNTDPVLARACLFNLMDNAVAHSPENSQVHCTIKALGDHQEMIVVTIDNPCGELRDCDITHVCEPFWRKEAARSQSGHFGLGMALVKAYARALSVQFEFKLDRQSHFIASLHFSA